MNAKRGRRLKPLKAVKSLKSVKAGDSTSPIREEITPQEQPPLTPSTPSTTPSAASATSASPQPISGSAPDDAQDTRARTPKEISAIQRLYQATGSMEKTAEFFGISPGTVHRYCAGIQIPPEVREQLAQTNSPVADAEQANDHQDSHESENIRAPRLPFEINADRPRVYEPDSETDALARAPRMMTANTDDWNEIVSQIRAAAWNARYRGTAADFYSDRILPDLEIADVAKTLAGSNDPEFVREALSVIWKKALALDRIQQQAGLNGGERPHQRQPERGALN